jgi:hypothetical protein
MNKAERHAAIRERARAAIADLHHNGTPTYPDGDCDGFFDWLQAAAESEFDYVNDGGAYGLDYAATLRHPANAGRYTSDAARLRYVRRGMQAMRLERDRWARWEWTRERFGRIYSWGRGGRTVAPEGLIRTHGGSRFSTDEGLPAERSIAFCVDLILVLESFNAYVRAWCDGLPSMWREHCEELEREREEERRERAEWEARDVVTV